MEARVFGGGSRKRGNEEGKSESIGRGNSTGDNISGDDYNDDARNLSESEENSSSRGDGAGSIPGCRHHRRHSTRDSSFASSSFHGAARGEDEGLSHDHETDSSRDPDLLFGIKKAVAKIPWHLRGKPGSKRHAVRTILKRRLGSTKRGEQEEGGGRRTSVPWATAMGGVREADAVEREDRGGSCSVCSSKGEGVAQRHGDPHQTPLDEHCQGVAAEDGATRAAGAEATAFSASTLAGLEATAGGSSAADITALESAELVRPSRVVLRDTPGQRQVGRHAERGTHRVRLGSIDASSSESCRSGSSRDGAGNGGETRSGGSSLNLL